MAAAALRHAARRLGGRALQPVQRARFTTQSLAAAEKKEAAGLLAEIKTKKEELYDVVARCQRTCVVDGATGSQNGQLLECLSHQVEPKPNDPHWRSWHRAATTKNYIRTAGLYCIGFTIYHTFKYLGKQVQYIYPEGKGSGEPARAIRPKMDID